MTIGRAIRESPLRLERQTPICHPERSEGSPTAQNINIRHNTLRRTAQNENAGCFACYAKTEYAHRKYALRFGENIAIRIVDIVPRRRNENRWQIKRKIIRNGIFILTNIGTFDKIARLTKSFGLCPAHSARSQASAQTFFLRRRIEVVITGRTRNALALTGSRVRISPSPP